MRIHCEDIEYFVNGKRFVGYLCLPEESPNELSGVLVAPEWWGLSSHPKNAAERLAKIGYAALAIDVYGDGIVTDEANIANERMMAVLNDPSALPERTAAALRYFQDRREINAHRIAAIGFCFGGKVALDMARRGQDIVAAVSFHGNLTPAAPAIAGILKAEILVEHGHEDTMVSMTDLDAFHKEMDAANATYHVDVFSGAKHGFTNPKATENGEKNGVDLAYNKEAAEAAWQNMLNLFERVL